MNQILTSLTLGALLFPFAYGGEDKSLTIELRPKGAALGSPVELKVKGQRHQPPISLYGPDAQQPGSKLTSFLSDVIKVNREGQYAEYREMWASEDRAELDKTGGDIEVWKRNQSGFRSFGRAELLGSFEYGEYLICILSLTRQDGNLQLLPFVLKAQGGSDRFVLTQGLKNDAVYRYLTEAVGRQWLAQFEESTKKKGGAQQ